MSKRKAVPHVWVVECNGFAFRMTTSRENARAICDVEYAKDYPHESNTYRVRKYVREQK